MQHKEQLYHLDLTKQELSVMAMALGELQRTTYETTGFPYFLQQDYNRQLFSTIQFLLEKLTPLLQQSNILHSIDTVAPKDNDDSIND